MSKLPNPSSPLPWFRCASESLNPKPRKPMAYFHPFRPFVKRTLGHSVSDSPGKSFHLPCNPLVHFRATQAAFPHACRAFTRWPRSTSDHPQNAPRIRSSAFKHFRIEKPFFFASRFRETCEELCPVPHKPRARVWLPSPRWFFLAFRSLGASFSPQRS